MFTHKFSKGFLIVYQNNLSKDYKESLTFKVLENLRILTDKGEI